MASASLPGPSESTWWEHPRFVVTSAVVAGILLAVADLAGGPEANYSGLLLVMPLIASTAGSAHRTLRFALVALAMGLALFVVNDLHWLEIVFRSLVLAIGGGFAVGLSMARNRREQRLVDLNRFATVAQELILRPLPGQIGGVRLAGRYLAASDVLIVGGDLYEVAATPHGLRFIIGDAKGKGLDGVRTAASLLTAFRQGACAFDDLGELVADLEREIAEGRLPGIGTGPDPDFATAVVGQLSDDGALVLANCGHLDGIVVTGDDARALVCTERSLPLGLGACPTLEVHALEPGDRVLFFTDGVSEARDATGRFLDDELLVLTAVVEPSIGALVDRLADAAAAHVGGHMQDDVAIIGLEFVGVDRRINGASTGGDSVGRMRAGAGRSGPEVDVDVDLTFGGDLGAEPRADLEPEGRATTGR